MSDILRIKGLWGGYKVGVDILRGIDMTVREGESVGIIGLNGSGKSTLGKAIMNMIPFRRGEILFDGEDITGLSTCELVRKGISIMQQGGRVFPNLSVWENLELAFASGMESSLAQLQEIIPLLQQPKKHLRHQGADKLSGGQKHQLALAMTLATRPRLVILDEPSAGLSPKSVEEMYGVMLDMRKKLNVSVLLIEQNVAKAHLYCNYSLLINQGGIVRKYDANALDEMESTMFKGLV